MRIVVDTNVFVSAVLKLNSLPFLVVRWIDEYDGLLKSAGNRTGDFECPVATADRRGDDPGLP
jgi:hypothetical protein